MFNLRSKQTGGQHITKVPANISEWAPLAVQLVVETGSLWHQGIVGVYTARTGALDSVGASLDRPGLAG